MNVDCDGADNGADRCGDDPSGQGETSFKDEIQSDDYGIDDLNANVHTYVVFGNEGANPAWLPSKVGVQSLSVIAVVCNNKLVRLCPPSPAPAQRV